MKGLHVCFSNGIKYPCKQPALGVHTDGGQRKLNTSELCQQLFFLCLKLSGLEVLKL